MDQKWRRKEFETWDEAFRALAPIIRQQSVRVASYAQVLYVQACASAWSKKTPLGAERINSKYAELAYKCGMYHQLGKALVPTEYQILQKDFTEEEIAVYQKYTTDGRQLVTRLQEKSIRSKAKRTGNEVFTTDNIPYLMIRETCQQHMEHYDGSGFPDGLSGDDISPIAQIVGLAKELDRLVSETKSETPFAEAFDRIMDMSGTVFAPDLIKVLQKAHDKCYEVYEKYINYTLTLPKTIPIVEKTKDRPMGLKFYPIEDGIEGKVVAYKAVSWFGGLKDDPTEIETMEEIEEQLKRLELIPDMTFYFLYEATDLLLRIKNCNIPIESVIVQMFPSFYTSGNHQERFNKLFSDQPIDKSHLILTIPQSVILEANKSVQANLNRYIRHGVRFIIDRWNPNLLSLQDIKDFGIDLVFPDPDLYLTNELSDALRAAKDAGISFFAQSGDCNEWSIVSGARGLIMHTTVSEDDAIRTNLRR